jgi:hypothetical protein
VQVETESTQLGDVIESKKMLDLPLNGRSYVDLLGLQAGVAPESAGTIGGDRPVSGTLSAGNISVNGQREASNAFLVNGGDVSEGRNMGAGLIPNIDSIEEFRLLTNSFAAEYGKFSGGVMNAITKSGGNGFHGDVFEFVRNDTLDARNFFAPTKSELRRNQFGYAVGGPFWKNRLFWFTDYQGTRQVQGAESGIVQVIPSAQRQGIFDPSMLTGAVDGEYWAQLLSARLGYTVTNGEPYNQVFPDGVIPQRAWSPAAVGTLKFIPLGNMDPAAGIYDDNSVKNRVRDDKAGQRVDFVNAKTGNWSWYYHLDESAVHDALPSASVAGFPAYTPQRAQMVVMSNTKAIGPTKVNEARVSFFRTAMNQNQPEGAFSSLSDLGIINGAGTLGIIPSGPAGFPQFVPPIYFDTFTIGEPSLTTGQYNNTWMLSDGFSLVKGSHQLKFGGEFRYLQINERNIASALGTYSFDGTVTGSAVADYLLGAVSTNGFQQYSEQFLDSRTRYGGAYIQDSWKVRPNLTLNLGLRWEVSMPWYDTQGKIETIVPGLQSVMFPTSPVGWVVAGDPGVPSTLAPTRWNNLAPRLGLAWSPNVSGGLLGKILGGPGKTSIRAAWGLYYTSIEDLDMFMEVGDPPFGQNWESPTGVLFEEPYVTRSNGVSQGQKFPFSNPVPGSPANKTLDFSQFLPLSWVPGYDIHNRMPYAEDYNISIQRELSKSTVMTLAYVGTQGHKLIAQIDANPGDPALCLHLNAIGAVDLNTGSSNPACGPNRSQDTFQLPDGSLVYGTRTALGPAFGAHNGYTRNFANSNYNSLQATVQRKAANLSFLVAYTFSKAIDNSSSFDQGVMVNFSNYRLSRGLSSFDSTHNLVASYTWNIPFDRAFSGLPRRLTQGWTVTGISRFATGLPVQIRQTIGDFSLTGSNSTDEPNLVGPVVTQDPRLAGPNGANTYFLPGAFTSETLGTFGTANRRFFHGPGIYNTDFGMSKRVPITESMSIQIRAEFFNVFNHTQFNQPNGNFSSSLFGVVTQARDPRIGQISAKFYW